jgi:hypothetical protein
MCSRRQPGILPEIGLGEMFKSCVHELRGIDPEGIEAKAAEAIHSVDNIFGRLADGARHVPAQPPNLGTAAPH